MAATSDTYHRCDRCLLRRFGTAGGLASHKRAHERSDGRLVRELADRAACLVRGYDRIDDLALAVGYQVRDAARAAKFYGLPAAELATAERLALEAVHRHPVTDAARSAVATLAKES